MLAGGDLGLSRLFLLVFLFGPVIGFVAHRKWRLAEARKEEIKRLLVLASEEAARAELEASSVYVNSGPVIERQLQHQCAVCFCPTTTRCARCKVVRYCSGKCQIVHWRQGHKEECRPFVTTKLIDDLGGASKVATSSSEPRIDLAVNAASDSGRIDGHHLGNIVPNKIETVYVDNLNRIKSLSSESPPMINLVDSFTSSSKLYSSGTDSSDGDTHSGSSSSGWTVDDSNESSISEPSTPSSGFWEGTMDSSRSKNERLDDSAQSMSSKTCVASVSFSHSSGKCTSDCDRDAVIPLHEQDPPMSMGIKRLNDATALSKEKIKDSLKAGIASSTSEVSDHIDNDPSCDSDALRSKENKNLSGTASFSSPASSNGGNSRSVNTSNVSNNFSFLGTDRLNHVVDGMGGASHLPKSKEVKSFSAKPSDMHISSGSQKHSVSCEVTGKVDDGCEIAACNKLKTSASRAVDQRSGKVDSGREVVACTNLKTSVWKAVDQLVSSNLSRHYSSGVGIQITGRYNHKGLFPYELFVKLYNTKKVGVRPCGLINCGNSCYANAVLQCLIFTPPLTAYLFEGLHSKACGKKGWCFTCEFECLVLKAKDGNSPLSPIGILSQIQNIGSRLSNGREEDAHEFLRYAIDTMQSVCLKENGVTTAGSLEDETSLIGLTFGGYLQSKIQCMKCGVKSERHEKMMDLTVEIDGDIDTLEEALRKFTSTEILDGGNKYQCSRCKSYEKAKKRLTVLEAPNVLTIALKRFQSGKYGKLNKMVQFPEILNLAPYMIGTSDKAPIYSLYGVVVHLDVMNASFSGHYVSYIKNIQNKWFKIDDSMVEGVEVERVLTKGAYMLLYARCSPRAPKLIRNSIAPHDSKKSMNLTSKSRSRTPGPRDVSVSELSNGQANSRPPYTSHPSLQMHRKIFEEDSSSDNSSSVCFSEEGSSSTESTRGSSADEFFDQLFGDLGYNMNSYWRNSSDSETSSSSSSCSPSPLYSKHLGDTDRYASQYPKTSGSFINNPESALEDQYPQRRLSSRSGKSAIAENKGSAPSLYYDRAEQCRKLGGSNSSSTSNRSKDVDSARLGQVNPHNIKSDMYLRRSTRERRT